MMFKIATAATVLLVLTTALAQGSSPAATAAGTSFMSQRKSPAGSGMPSLVGNKTAGVQTPATLRERVQDMEVTLAKMHVVLKQMRAKAASGSKDPLAKANLDMWELLVEHLDKQLQELRVAMVTREDMEARRAAMYKQVDAKADAAARTARAAHSGQAVTATPAGQGAGQSSAGQPSSGPPADASPSPK